MSLLCQRFFVVTILLIACHAVAQVEVIPDLPITLSGSVSAGYNGGSAGASGTSSGVTNSFIVGTQDDLSGYYHDPRFLNFSFSPRLTWSHDSSGANTALQDRNDGFASNIDFLQQSKVPIHFSYNISQTNTSTLTGGPNAFTVGADGLVKSCSVSISEHLNFLPPINLSYSHTDTDTSVTGVQEPSEHTHTNFLTVSSNYRFLGFFMNGSYTRNSSEAQTQDLLNLGVPQATIEDWQGNRCPCRKAAGVQIGAPVLTYAQRPIEGDDRVGLAFL